MAKLSKRRKQSAKPEIVLKQFVQYASRDGKRSLPEPALLLLANKQGYKWLAEYFGDLAKRDWHTSATCYGDPDDHQHLDVYWPPFNSELSDSMEIRLGVLTPENRRAVMRKYEISKITARHNSLIARYRMFIAWAKRRVSIGKFGFNAYV